MTRRGEQPGKKEERKRGVGRDSGHTLLHLLITLSVRLPVPAIEAKTALLVRFLGWIGSN